MIDIKFIIFIKGFYDLIDDLLKVNQANINLKPFY